MELYNFWLNFLFSTVFDNTGKLKKVEFGPRFLASKSGNQCYFSAVLDPEGLVMNYLQIDKSDKMSKDFKHYLYTWLSILIFFHKVILYCLRF